MTVTRKELRSEFPDMSLEQFLFIVDTLGLEEPDALRTVLAEENEKARLAKEDERRALFERYDAITASMLHRKLNIVAPPEASPEHVRAILVYGFAAPSARQTFVGEHALPREHIVDDVRNKLTRDFDPRLFEFAERFLLQNGVIVRRQGMRAGSMVYALNIKESARGVTPRGREIIRALKRFMHEHRPR